MVILISPTKTFTNNNINATNTPYFTSKSNYLINEVQKLNKDELISKFKVSEKLGETTYNYYKDIHNNYQAIYQYGGTAFKYLDPLTITNNLSNIYILSGLYGILNAKDGISPYRLEISSNIFGNLYDYWQDDVNQFLQDSHNDKQIINLASNEYSKHLDCDKLNIITIDFILNKNGKNTSQSMMLKKMRGLMARFIANNNITKVDDLKKIIIEEFQFNSNLSTDKLLMFYKEE